MKSSIENIDTTHIRIDVTIQDTDWQKASNRIYGYYASQLEIPGFRKGRAPRNVVEKHIGPKQVFEAIREEVVNNTVVDAIQSHDLKPLSSPDLDIKSLEELDEVPKNQELAYSATIEIWPDVDEFKYKGLKINTTKRDVTDENLEEGLKTVQSRFAEKKEVTDRGVQKGDLVTFKFKGEAEAPAPEGSDEKPEPFLMDDEYTISVGEDDSIPGISEALEGLKIGEENNFEITIPDAFPREDLRGKPMKSHAKIINIQEVILPELTDEFAKEKLSFENVDELRKNLKDSMEHQNSELKKKEAVEALEEHFINITNFTPPDSLLQSRKEMILDNMHGYYRRNNMDLDEIMRDKEKAAEVEKKVAEEAESQTRLEMVYDEIAGKENIKVDAEEVKNYIYMMQQYSQLKEKDVKRMLKDQNFILSVRNDIKNRKVIDFLLENNEMIELDDPSQCERRVEFDEVELDSKQEDEVEAEAKTEAEDESTEKSEGGE